MDGHTLTLATLLSRYRYMVTRFAAPAGFFQLHVASAALSVFLAFFFFSALTMLTVALRSDACSASIANIVAFFWSLQRRLLLYNTTPTVCKHHQRSGCKVGFFFSFCFLFFLGGDRCFATRLMLRLCACGAPNVACSNALT